MTNDFCNVLAMVGSVGTTTVAIFSKNICIAQISIPGKTCSRDLVGTIDLVLQQANLKLSDVDLISCETGPGSFTGLRILIVTANALGFANGIPLVGKNSLRLIFDSVKDVVVEADFIIPAINAYSGQIYCSLFDAKTRDAVLEDLCVGIAKLPEILKNVSPQRRLVFAGELCEQVETAIFQSLPNREIVFVEPENDKVIQHLATKISFDVEGSLRPLYIKANFGSVLSLD